MKLTIDDREIICQGGPTLLEAARGAGILIPSLCDHPGLEPFAGCRICLVEILGRKDFAPACVTSAAEGMVVRTRTPELVALRKKILEFILAEHPYACLVCAEKSTCDDLKSTIRKVGEVTGCVLCPANGGCELQKVVQEVGLDKVDLPAVYRNLEVRREDPFFDRDYNLCILCGRCIRVCEEVRGASVLAFVQRGGRTGVSTAFDRPLLDSGCRFCGACIDVCPTGALVERAARPQPRATRSANVVCPFCGQACVLALGIREDKILDAKPVDAPPNNGQACVKGRFLIRGALADSGRILEPHVRKDGRLVPATFDEALDRAAAGLGDAAEGCRALIYPTQISLEDAFLFLEFGREVWKTAALAETAPLSVWSALDASPGAGALGIPPSYELAEIADCRSILAWDIDLPTDHPIAWLRVVQAVRRGAGLVAVGRLPAGPLPQAVVTLDMKPGAEAARGASLAAALLRAGVAPSVEDGFEDFVRSIPEERTSSGPGLDALQAAADILASNRPSVILFDAGAARGPSGPKTLAWLWNIGCLLGARLFPLGRGGNERGIHVLEQALATPASGKGWEALRAGLQARAFQALYLAGPAPDLEDLRPPFLVCQDTHWSRNAAAADVIFPAAAFAESGGTWVNTEGRVRMFPPAIPCPGAARNDGAILAALARKMGHPGFGRPDAAAVLREIRTRVPALAHVGPAGGDASEFLARERPFGTPRFVAVSSSPGSQEPLAGGRILLKVRYSGDGLRGFDPLARSRGYARVRKPGRVLLHPDDAARLGIADGEALELRSGSGALAAVAGFEPAVAHGTAETAVRGSSLTERDWLDRGLVPVEIGRKR